MTSQRGRRRRRGTIGHIAVTAAIALSGLTGCTSADISEHISQSPAWHKGAKSDTGCLNYREGTISYVSENKMSLFDSRTGVRKWISDDLGKDSGCPLYTPTGVYYGLGTNTVAALNPATGKNLWKKRYDDFLDYATLRPYASNGDIHFLVNNSIITIDPKTRKESWRHTEQEDMWIVNMATAGDMVIATTANGKVRGISAADGKVAWTYTTPTHARINQVPTVAADTVYVGSYDAHIYALSTTNGKLKWKTKLEAGTDWSPVTTHDTLLIVDNYNFNGIDIRNGHRKWTVDYHDPTDAISNGQNLIYSNEKEKRFYGINPDNGERIWQLNIKEKLMHWSLGKNMLYITTPTQLNAYKLP